MRIFETKGHARKVDTHPIKVGQEPTELFMVDGLPAQDVAMLQALYSRSKLSVRDHLAKLASAGSGSFMSKYYVGYNHRAIGDCGSVTFFAEGVSLLAAKAIENWPLYRGTETSTRYMDMGSRSVVDPVGSGESASILGRWMQFYRDAQGPVAEEVRRRHPRAEGESAQAYEGAVAARTFDVCRAWLPAGVTTQLSWHTDLRQAGDHLAPLRASRLAEVRGLAAGMTEIFAKGCPESAAASFGSGVSGEAANAERRAAADSWNAMVADAEYARGWSKTWKESPMWKARGSEFETTIDDGAIAEHAELLARRPRGCVLPHYLSAIGQACFRYYLDFGSFRDIQRQRNGVVRMPLLTTNHGFESWYLNELPDGLILRARDLIDDQADAIKRLPCDDHERQNYIALGFRVPVEATFGLPATVYVLELRSAKSVHPTLRGRTLRGVELFRKRFPSVALHADTDPDSWTVRRGTQTITERS